MYILIALIRTLLTLYIKANDSMRVEIGHELLSVVKRLVGTVDAIAPHGSGSWYMTPEEHAMVKANAGKIETIKAIRTRTGLGLKDAKDLFERFYPQIPLIAGEPRLSYADVAYKLNNLIRLSPDWEDGTMIHNQEKGFYLNMRNVASALGLDIDGQNKFYKT